MQTLPRPYRQITFVELPCARPPAHTTSPHCRWQRPGVRAQAQDTKHAQDVKTKEEQTYLGWDSMLRRHPRLKVRTSSKRCDGFECDIAGRPFGR